jgi:chemotaxis protein MotB
MDRYSLLVASLGLMLLVGCSASDHRDLEYRISKSEGERDQLQLALDDERAKVVILQERATAEQREHELARAELKLMHDRVRELERNNDELLALLERRDKARIQPAEVPTPLPEDVDRHLQAFAARHRGRVWYDRGRAAVSLANDRLFESGSEEVHAAAQAMLGELAGIAALTPADDFEIIIVGHTDDTPISDPATLAKHPSNWHLSVHRAIAVKDTFVCAGLPETRMGVMGYGACRPVGDDKARNRRVEVFFVRKGEAKPVPAIPAPAEGPP